MARTLLEGRTRRRQTALSTDLRGVVRYRRVVDASESLPRIPASFPAADWTRRVGKARKGSFDGGRCAFGNELVNWSRRPLSGSPLAIVGFCPEDILEPVGNCEAAVGCALGNDPCGPEVHRNMGPVVFASYEFVPLGVEFLLPSLVGREQAPQRTNDQHDSVI